MRLQVNVSEELVKQIDEYAQLMGVSRSSLCATFIGQGVMTYNKTFKALDEVAKSAMESVTNK